MRLLPRNPTTAGGQHGKSFLKSSCHHQCKHAIQDWGQCYNCIKVFFSVYHNQYHSWNGLGTAGARALSAVCKISAGPRSSTDKIYQTLNICLSKCLARYFDQLTWTEANSSPAMPLHSQVILFGGPHDRQNHHRCFAVCIWLINYWTSLKMYSATAAAHEKIVVLEGFVVTVQEGACETGSKIRGR